MVCLCLFFLDVATCSLELCKHVVGDVVRRLGTFGSRALSTLTPLFFVVFDVNQKRDVFFCFLDIFVSCPGNHLSNY